MAGTPHGPENGTNGIPAHGGGLPGYRFWGGKSFTKLFGTKPYIDDLLHGTPDRDNLESSEKLSRLCIEDHESQLRELSEILAY